MDLDQADTLRLNRVQGFSPALLHAPSYELWRHLPGPTLFEIPGKHASPLFVSVLLHGNESTGWAAIQSVLNRHHGHLPRSLMLFVGNVDAARYTVRTLRSQTDYNRSWPGTLDDLTPEARVMREVVDAVRVQKPFGSIDIHNNSGHNPHYACVNRRDDRYVQLARLFSRTVVYFERPLGVQSAALSQLCPSVTVECGLAGGPEGVAHAADFIEAALAIDHLPDRPVPDGDLDLMQTHAIIKIPTGATVSFDGTDADFQFRSDLDRLNFSELEPGTLFGRLGSRRRHLLNIEPGGPHATSSDYFTYGDGEIRLCKRAIPAMLTRDNNAIRLDCLGYLMHRVARDGSRLVEADTAVMG
ncbi:MAG: succinylglutamate desuccinylase/aspartoacylase family protein [Hyphomicrobium sp.]|nr:succinylglutamate desuccinylase/aspartoacylase family protein [Hyphomicrobium sp.]